MEDKSTGICGCGKLARYMIKGTDGSCNKYARCMTYEEMRETLAMANKIIFQLREAMEKVAETHEATGTANFLNRILRETSI
jgi:hypothetical protein